MNGIKRFLLVEDNETDTEFVQMAFKGSAHKLNAVVDGQEAIDYLSGVGAYSDRQKFPLPEVILLDIKMPRVDGFDFLKWLRHKSPGDLRLLPVVIMSSSDEPSDIKRAYEHGVNSYLTKPISWTDFRERMKALNIFWGSHAEVPPVTGT